MGTVVELLNQLGSWWLVSWKRVSDIYWTGIFRAKKQKPAELSGSPESLY